MSSNNNFLYPHERTFDQSEVKNFRENCGTNYRPLPTVLPKANRIIAIGDIHGDYGATLHCLKIACLIDDDLNWVAVPKNTVVVQIGDQIDRCRSHPLKYDCDNPKATPNDEGSDIKIMELFTNLHNQAIKYGGGVYSLLGNHELMNVKGNMNYVSYKGLTQFDNYNCINEPNKKFKSGKEARIHAFKPGNQYGKFLGCTRQSALIVGSFLFVHAGILPQLLDVLKMNDKNDLQLLNKYVRQWLVGVIDETDIMDIVNSTKYSPFWTRIMGYIKPKLSEHDHCGRFLEPVLKVFKLDSMIVGHTPQFVENKAGINDTCGGKLWRVDTGFSDAFREFDPILTKNPSTKSKYRNIQVLEILNEEKFNILDEDNYSCRTQKEEYNKIYKLTTKKEKQVETEYCKKV
jgi:hypothetical protein